jgi:hypothetical protein
MSLIKSQEEKNYWEDNQHKTKLNMIFYKFIQGDIDESLIFTIYHLDSDTLTFLKKYIEVLTVPNNVIDHSLIENKLLLCLQTWLTDYFPQDWTEECSKILDQFLDKLEDKKLIQCVKDIKRISKKKPIEKIEEFNFQICFVNEFLLLDDCEIAKEISLISETIFESFTHYDFYKINGNTYVYKKHGKFFHFLTNFTTEFILLQETPE